MVAISFFVFSALVSRSRIVSARRAATWEQRPEVLPTELRERELEAAVQRRVHPRGAAASGADGLHLLHGQQRHLHPELVHR
jgi:hypothetical protein